MDEQNRKDLPIKGIPQEPDAPANDAAPAVAETTEITEERPKTVPETGEPTEPVPTEEESTPETAQGDELPETEGEPRPVPDEAPLPDEGGEAPLQEPAEEEVPPSDSPTPPYDPQPTLEALMAQTQEMTRQLCAMEELFTKRILYTDHEEKTLDRMHSELQRYKEDLYFKLIKPILVDVLEMRDSIIRMAELYAAKPEGQQDIPLKTFSNYAYDLQEILEKNGIEIFRSEPGGDYIPLRQRVVKKLPTTEEALHGKVAQSITSGYLNGDKVLSPEKVSVYVYEAPKEG